MWESLTNIHLNFQNSDNANLRKKFNKIIKTLNKYIAYSTVLIKSINYKTYLSINISKNKNN